LIQRYIIAARISRYAKFTKRTFKRLSNLSGIKRTHKINMGPALAEHRKKTTGIKSLAEAVILQSLEDLWDPSHRIESIDFFNGDGYRIFAKLAGLNQAHSYKMLNIPWEKKRVKTRNFSTRKYQA